MMRELEILFTQREIPFNAQDNRISCFPHIINIVAQHVIDKFLNYIASSLSDDSSQDENPRDHHSLPPKMFQEACACDPLH